jgi:hypothetical protein
MWIIAKSLDKMSPRINELVRSVSHLGFVVEVSEGSNGFVCC